MKPIVFGEGALPTSTFSHDDPTPTFLAPAGYRRTAFGPLPVADRVEVEWLLEDDAGNVRVVLVCGEATSRPGVVDIDGFECVDAKTGTEVDMLDHDQERAEEDLRDAAIRMWRSR